jgi:hypothetical protein
MFVISLKCIERVWLFSEFKHHIIGAFLLFGFGEIIRSVLVCRAAESLIDMLIDAAAVAKDDLGMRKTRLYVYQCYCDEGPTMKKFWPVAQGRLVKIRKRTSHLTVKLAEYDDETYQVRGSLKSSVVALLAKNTGML